MPESASPAPWPLELSETLQDYGMFQVRRDRSRSPRTGAVHEFHVVESPEGVTVLALTPAEELVLVEQFRHPRREVTLETPSGVVDGGEDPVAAALRELREETGYTGGEAERLGTLVLNPSWQTTLVHVVLVRGVQRRVEQELDAGEDTRVRTVPLERARNMVRTGEINSAVVIAALGRLDLQPRSEPDANGRGGGR